MSNGGYVPNSVEEPVPYKYHKLKDVYDASSGMNSAPYIQDGNTTTSWVADTPGKDSGYIWKLNTVELICTRHNYYLIKKCIHTQFSIRPIMRLMMNG